MTDMEELAEESRRHRDMWLLAVGAAMADEKWRPRLTGYCPSELVELVAAVRDGNAPRGWKALGKWRVTQSGSQLAVERLFHSLEAMERQRQTRQTVIELAAAVESGDMDTAKAKAKEIADG